MRGLRGAALAMILLAGIAVATGCAAPRAIGKAATGVVNTAGKVATGAVKTTGKVVSNVTSPLRSGRR